MVKEKMIENFLMRIYLEVIENIAGKNGLKSILHYGHLETYIDNFPPDDGKVETPAKDAKHLIHSLEDILGKKGSRGLSLRVGREFTRHLIEGRPTIAKSLKLASKLVPENIKMRIVLEKCVDQYDTIYTFTTEGPHSKYIEEENYFLFYVYDFFMSDEVSSDNPVCDINVGMFEHFMKWITGHHHKVEEIECRAMGDPADVFKIWKAHDDETG